ncbi:glutamate--cysteine ligase [Monosporozyma unispora]|nr:glutamate--cysteine ligase [Kazachstania unispora]
MGLLAAGTPLPWHEARNLADHIRSEGIEQLLEVFKAAGKRDNDPLYWGDELEYMMIELDSTEQNAMVDVIHDKVLTDLNTTENFLCQENDIEFHPEYGRYMLEATPESPYHGLKFTQEFIEDNMKRRRVIADALLSKYNQPENGKKYVVLALTVFPRLGSDQFINIPHVWNHKNSASRSLFLPDEVINRHVRFPTLTANIRERRGEKVYMNIPMFKDINTPDHDTTVYERNWFIPEDMESLKASKPGHIYLDGMGFGMGSSCLQMTYQAPNVEMARFLYDSLINFAPIMLSVSAAAPAFKGWLADQDVRWNVISGAVDCRTPYERDVEPILPKYNSGGFGSVTEEAKKHLQKIPKSRYSVVDLYLGGHNKFFNRNYNNTNVPINEKVLKRLLENNVAPLDYDLAKHFAHLFIRDSCSIFEESINQDRTTSTNHFENIQSTNWQTLRFKPPTQKAIPSEKNIPGWRVEFRPLEVQLTEFENAAHSIFIYLVVEAVLDSYNTLNPYLNMSKVWENMDIAHKRDSVLQNKFHWKTTFQSENGNTDLYSIDEIFHNKKNGIFETFINKALIKRNWIKSTWTELQNSTTHKRYYYYLKLISDRASGKLPTTAHFLRDFITTHKDYRHDSRVSKLINYDLVLLSDRITNLDNSQGDLIAFFGDDIANFLLENQI